MDASVTTRRELIKLVSGASAAAIALSVTEAQAQVFQINTVAITPRFDKLSDDVKNRLGPILLKQSLHESLNPVAGPKPCDDKFCEYSEFWVETRPKNMTGPIFVDPNDVLLSFAEEEAWKRLGEPTNYYEWSEEQFLEVKPMWDEMQPKDETEKPANVTLKLRVVEDGIPVKEPDFYRKILEGLYRGQNE